MRLIDAEQMKQIVDEYIEETGFDVFTVYHIHDFLDECDAVDAEPVKHGRWMKMGDADYMCSVCGFRFTSGDPITKFAHCRCGAKMDGGAW